MQDAVSFSSVEGLIHVVSIRRHNVLLANTPARSPQLSHHEPPSPTATTQSAYLQRSVAEHEGQGRSSPSAETVIWSGSTVARPLVLIITCSRAIKGTRCSQTWALSCRRILEQRRELKLKTPHHRLLQRKDHTQLFYS